MMETDRRKLLYYAGVTGLASMAGLSFWHTARPSPIILSAADDHQGRHCLVGKAITGAPRFCIPVPDRAHQALIIPHSPLALFFGRRPSTSLYVVNMDEGSLVKTITAPRGRHFYGHGALSIDGSLLFTSENAFREKLGKVGVYDISSAVQRIGEFDSGGIGPHQIDRLAGTNTLVVANGGMETHPDSGRQVLNWKTMSPNLSYIDTASTKILETVEPAHHQMSLRHLAVTHEHKVIIGVQDQSPAPHHGQLNPLVLLHQPGQSLRAFPASQGEWAQMSQYIASVAVSADGRWALTTTPRGNLVSVWDLHNPQPAHHVNVIDVAGAIWFEPERSFLVSNGLGQWVQIHPDSQNPNRVLTTHHDMHWDNHLTCPIDWS